MSSLAEQSAVYRCYGEGRNLLYVGSTGRLGARLRAHAEKIWFLDVRVITLEWYSDIASAAAAEREAIKSEAPQYNVVHNGDRNLYHPVLVGRPKSESRSTRNARELMRLLVRDAGSKGVSIDGLRREMEGNGHLPHRATLYRWLAEFGAEQIGNGLWAIRSSTD